MKQASRWFLCCTLAAALALTGCGGGNSGSSSGSMSGGTSAGSSAAQGAAWRTGLGVLTEATGTDRAGNIRTVAAAVLLDADGKLAVVTMDENARVTSAIGDMTEPELTVSADGTVSAPREPVYTKNELGDRYGMRSASALGKEWYEHSAGWCGYLKGKNAVEIGKLSADGTDADLKALCTISVTDLQKAVLKAMAEQ